MRRGVRDGLKAAAVAAMMGLMPGPTAAALLFTVPATDDGSGSFVATGAQTGPGLSTSGSVWIHTPGASINAVAWTVYGEQTANWWELIPDADTGEDVPNLTGNEYFWSPDCVQAGPGTCASSPALTVSILGPSTARVDLAIPPGFNFCGLGYQGTSANCAESFEVLFSDFVVAADAATTVGFYSTSVVPEPASWALLVTGFGLAGAAARRRRVPV